MNTMTAVAAAVGSVLLSAVAQVILKLGVSSTGVQLTFAGELPLWQKIAYALANPVVLAGLAVYGLSAAVWLAVLVRFDLSKAYPFVGLGFIVVMISGAVMFGEKLDITRVAGTLLVTAGVVLVARS